MLVESMEKSSDWSQEAAHIEYYHLHLETKTYTTDLLQIQVLRSVKIAIFSFLDKWDKIWEDKFSLHHSEKSLEEFLIELEFLQTLNVAMKITSSFIAYNLSKVFFQCSSPIDTPLLPLSQ